MTIQQFSNIAINKANLAKKALILTHANPDGDAIGSALAVYDYLDSKNISTSIILTSALPENLKFLLNGENLIYFDENTDESLFNEADLIFILDLSDPERLRSTQKFVTESLAFTINIDHHLEPKDFADLAFVDSEASSTGELVWKLLNEDKSYKLSKKGASAIYAAIMTDTGSFRFPKTDSEVHRIVSSLIDAGADPVELFDEIYNKMSFESTKLLGEAFAGLRTFYDGKFVLMHIKKEMFAKTGAKEEDVENFVERLMSIKGACAGMLVTEIPDRKELRISFRSKGDYSVRQLATEFGGGGHFNASGTRTNEFNSADEIIDEIIQRAGQLFNFS